jgi:hypothetical protein
VHALHLIIRSFFQTSAEVQVQDLYNSFLKAYAFFEMMNKADPTSEIYEKVEEQKIEMRKIICKISLLMINKGNNMHDFPLYAKHKETAIFFPQFHLGMNLYIYVNQIQDFLKSVHLVGRRSLQSLIL